MRYQSKVSIEQYGEYSWCLQFPCFMCRRNAPHDVPKDCVRNPNPSQRKALAWDVPDDDLRRGNWKSREEARIVLSFDGGFGASKTEAVARAILGTGLMYGGLYLATAPTEEQLRETLRRRIMDILSVEMPDMVVGSQPSEPKEERLGRVMVRRHDLRGVFEILFQGYDEAKKGEKFRNYELAGVAIDQAEKMKVEHIDELVARLRDPAVPPRAYRIWMASNSGGSGWIYRKFSKETERPPGWFGVRIATKENSKNLPAGYEQTLRNTFSREKARLYLDAEEADTSGLCFPMFNQDKHVWKCEMLCASWPKVVAIDPGMDHPTAAIWAVLRPDGVVHVYDEYSERGLVISHNAANIRGRFRESHHRMFIGKARAGMERFPTVEDFTWVIDPSSRKRANATGQRDIDEWMRVGLPVMPADNRKNIGIDTVRRLMEEVADDGLPKFRIDPRCTKTIEQLENLRTDEDVGDDESDCVRYSCAYLALGGSSENEELVQPGQPQFSQDRPQGWNYMYDPSSLQKEWGMTEE